MARKVDTAVSHQAWLDIMRIQVNGSSAFGRAYSGCNLYMLGIMLVKLVIVRPSITLFQVPGK